MGIFDWQLGSANPEPRYVPTITGDGRFACEVVGESYRQDSLERLGAEARRQRCDWVPAMLVLEDDNPHDAQAVRVEIAGLHVGYLSRAQAPQFREAVQATAFPKEKSFQCKAVLRGGGDKAWGVWLDIPPHKLDA